MLTLPTVLRILAPVFLLVGAGHLVSGLGMDALLGARLPPQVLQDAVLDSQNRFYGVMFAGYGALLLVAASDLRVFAPVLRITAGFLFAGGVARLISVALHGPLSPPATALLVIELVAPPPLLWWHQSVLRRLT